MQPNDNFRFRYPELWQRHYGGDECPPEEIHVGLYAIVLAIGYLTGFYPLLIECIGPLYANAIMDYAMFCIDHRTNASHLFEVNMADRMLFSRKVFSDSWFSSMLTEKLSSSQIDRFRREWPATCGAQGSGKVWLCINVNVVPRESGVKKNFFSFVFLSEEESARALSYRSPCPRGRMIAPGFVLGKETEGPDVP